MKVVHINLPGDACNFIFMMEPVLNTFRHIIQHSLMPWLAENQDIQKFKVLTRNIPFTDTGRSYFSRLQTVYKQAGIEIPVILSTEWDNFSRLPEAAGSAPIREIFGTQVSRDKQYEFYLRLITEATCAYFSRIESYTGENQSADLRKSRASTILKCCHDLMEQAVVLLVQKAAYSHILTELLTGLKIIFLETGILHRGFYEPYLLYLNDEEICALGKQETGENKSGVDIIRLGSRFEAYYNNRMTAKVAVAKSQKTGDNADDNEEQPIAGSPGPEVRDENWLRFEALYTGHTTTAMDNSVLPKEEAEAEAPPGTAHNENPFINREEVMLILGIGKTTLGKMSQNGEIPCFKISGRYKYKRNDIKSYQQSLVNNPQKRKN